MPPVVRLKLRVRRPDGSRPYLDPRLLAVLCRTLGSHSWPSELFRTRRTWTSVSQNRPWNIRVLILKYLFWLSPTTTAKNSHAPRVGSDGRRWNKLLSCLGFNPRSPRGERPAGDRRQGSRPGVSIHAPRVGSDSGSLSSLLAQHSFNPRPVWGAT